MRSSAVVGLLLVGACGSAPEKQGGSTTVGASTGTTGIESPGTSSGSGTSSTGGLPQVTPSSTSGATGGLSSGTGTSSTTTTGGTLTSNSSSSSTGSSTGGTFVTAPHQSLPQIADNGSGLIPHAQLFTVSFQGFHSGSDFTVGQYADWLVHSDWLQAVGADYGVGTGEHVADVILPTPDAGSMLTDDQIQTFLMAFAQDAGGVWDGGSLFDDPSAYVMVYTPPGVTVLYGSGTSCKQFGGYHGVVDGGNFAYGVIPDCEGSFGWTPDSVWSATSHELIEGSTDPLLNGWYFSDFSQPWALDLPEVGDVCVGAGTITDDAGYVAQRIWSNSAAAAGTGSPCIPAPTGEVYYSVSPVGPSGNGLAVVRPSTAAQTVTFTLTGWSTAAIQGGWSIAAISTVGSFTPTVDFSNGQIFSSIDNGTTETLTLTVPANAPAESFATVEVLSTTDPTFQTFNEWPVSVYVE